VDVFTLIGLFVCLSCLILLIGVGGILLLWRRQVIALVRRQRRPAADIIDAEYTLNPQGEEPSRRV